MSKKISIEIPKNGTMKYEVKGVKGTACMEESNWINEIFGKEHLMDDEKTSEYYQKEAGLNTQTLGRGK